MEPNELLLSKIEHMSGVVIGLQAAVRALIATHPDPDRALVQVHLCTEDMIASALAANTTTSAQLLGLEKSVAFVTPSESQLSRARTV